MYDVAANTGWVNVGTDADTAMFAVESIRRWWDRIGAPAYPGATRLLITADGGGSGGSRLRLWKTQLAELATETGLEITVTHLPPGTSKWNRIEHRLFSAITLNWRGRPLETHEVVVQSIAATTTTTGLTVTATLDTNTYERGIKITYKEMKASRPATCTDTSSTATGTTRCAPRGAPLYPLSSREELGGLFLGLMTYLDVKTGRGKQHVRKAAIAFRRMKRGAAGPARYGESWIT